MLKSRLRASVFEALAMLIQLDSDLIKIRTKEECINHKLAQHLESVLNKMQLLGEHDVDIEYNKYEEEKKKSSNGRNIRPDIIVHKRLSGNSNNLIVIEAKKDYDTEKDRIKVTDLVNSDKYSYAIGVVISYLPEKEYLKIKFLEPDGTWSKYQLNKKHLKINKTQK